jgi:hypothetical protein
VIAAAASAAEHAPVATADPASEKQKSTEFETLPGQGLWPTVASGVIFVGVFVAFFLWLGGDRFVRRLVRSGEASGEARYRKLGEDDP